MSRKQRIADLEEEVADLKAELVIARSSCDWWSAQAKGEPELKPGPGLYVPHPFRYGATFGEDRCNVCWNPADHVVHLPSGERW